MAGETINFKLWYYTPNLPAAIIMTILFNALTLYHIYRLIKARTYFCIPFIIGGLFEVIGYAARAAAHNNTTAKIPYIIQSLLLLLAPPLFAASIYMILSRLIRVTNAQSHSLIRVRWLTKIFVTSDILCFFIQSGGGGIQARGNIDTFKLGERIILGGLILQIVVFGFFLVVAGTFHMRLRRQPTTASLDGRVSWERLMWILYGVSILITVRNLVRCVEYGMGSDGYLLVHEWVLYVFDGLLMAVTLAVCVTWYQDVLKVKKGDGEFGLEVQGVRPKASV